MLTRYTGYDISGLNGSNFSGNFAGRYGGYMSDDSTGFKIGKIEDSNVSNNMSEGHTTGFEVNEIRNSDFTQNIALGRNAALLLGEIDTKIAVISSIDQDMDKSNEIIEVLREISAVISNNSQNKSYISKLNDKLSDLIVSTAGGVLGGIGLDVVHKGVLGFLS